MRYYLLLLFVVYFCCNLSGQTEIKAQSETKSIEAPKSFYYRDTIITASGITFEFSKAKSNWDRFNCTIEINNPTKNYLIIDPREITGTINSTEKKFRDRKNGMLVVAPQNSKKFKIKFDQYDFLLPSVNISVGKIHFSDTLAALYDFTNIDIINENQRKNGPVQWSLVSKDFDINRGVRINGKLKYQGEKFLLFFPDNATLKTKDGSFNSIAEQGGIVASYNEFYYDRFNSYQKTLFIFPVKRNALKEKNNSILNLTGVFKEYSIKSIDGFNVTLKQGNSKNNANEADND